VILVVGRGKRIALRAMALFAGLFEDLLDYVFCFVGVEQGLTLVTTEGDEVELLGLLEAFETGGHAVRAVYIPPFAEARRMGHPSFLGVG
jgi:hypothetical protein